MTRSKRMLNNKGSKIQHARSRRNLTIDIIRVVLAVLVVYLHIDNYLYIRSGMSAVATVIDNYIIVLARLAVPMFFAISGYYFYKKNQADENKSVIKNIKHLLLILMGGVVLYIVGSVLLNGIDATTRPITSRGFFLFTFFNRATIVANSGVLWFILALISCYIIYYIFPKFFPKKYLYLLAGVLWYLAVCKSSAYGGVIMDKWSGYVQQSYVCLGLPYFTLGYFIHAHWNKIKQAVIINRQMVKILILAITLYLIEQTIFIANRDFNATAIENPITLPLLIASILIMAIQHPGKSTPKLSAIAANYSLYIYVTHFLVTMVLSRILYGDDVPSKVRYWKGLVCWFVVVAICVILSFIYTQLKKQFTNLFARHNKAPTIADPSQPVAS